MYNKNDHQEKIYSEFFSYYFLSQKNQEIRFNGDISFNYLNGQYQNLSITKDTNNFCPASPVFSDPVFKNSIIQELPHILFDDFSKIFIFDNTSKEDYSAEMLLALNYKNTSYTKFAKHYFTQVDTYLDFINPNDNIDVYNHKFKIILYMLENLNDKNSTDLAFKEKIINSLIEASHQKSILQPERLNIHNIKSLLLTTQNSQKAFFFLELFTTTLSNFTNNTPYIPYINNLTQLIESPDFNFNNKKILTNSISIFNKITSPKTQSNSKKSLSISLDNLFEETFILESTNIEQYDTHLELKINPDIIFHKFPDFFNTNAAKQLMREQDFYFGNMNNLSFLLRFSLGKEATVKVLLHETAQTDVFRNLLWVFAKEDKTSSFSLNTEKINLLDQQVKVNIMFFKKHFEFALYNAITQYLIEEKKSKIKSEVKKKKLSFDTSTMDEVNLFMKEYRLNSLLEIKESENSLIKKENVRVKI